MINVNSFINETRQRKKELILQEIQNYDTIVDEIEKARAKSNVINTFIVDYINRKVVEDTNLTNGSILETQNLTNEIITKIDIFKEKEVIKLKNSFPVTTELVNSSKNIYEMAGAVKLTFSNKVTRTISTDAGALWETIANISPYAINPESEFNIKIKGIDVIILNINTNIIEYIQLKTQKNTLTGSQVSRSVQELSIHQNPVFCAAFNNNSSWTFSNTNIPRVAGEDFWNRIAIPYNIICDQARNLILDLEREFVSFLE
ncbi:MAG: hypothetical protein R3331_09195 [Sulfurospirillaceae bacterium]|nr:hypothetical protein [Sulfurospirillaceae bacterium]